MTSQRHVVRSEDVPAAHKIAIYEAMRRHFENALDSYFTEPGPQDPRYDCGVAAEKTECVGIGALEDGDGLYVVMAIEGWADLQGFVVDLPKLDRDARQDDGTSLTVAQSDPASAVAIPVAEHSRLQAIEVAAREYKWLAELLDPTPAQSHAKTQARRMLMACLEQSHAT